MTFQSISMNQIPKQHNDVIYSYFLHSNVIMSTHNLTKKCVMERLFKELI